MSNTAVAVKPQEIAKKFLQDKALIDQIRVACTKMMTPDRVARIALTGILQSPKLLECFQSNAGKASIARALITATQRGLQVDGRQGHLVPFYSKVGTTGEKAMQAVFIPGYQGLIDLAYNHPNVAAIWAEVVYEKDEFSVRKGLNRDLVHVPYEGDDDPGRIVAAYAVCEMRSGAKVFEIVREREIKRIRAFSRGASNADSVWNTNEAAMWRKSAVRALCKMIPQSSELLEALSDDDEAGRITAEASKPSSPVFDVAATVTPVDAPALLDDSNPDLMPKAEPAKSEPAKAEAEPDYHAQLFDLVVTENKSNFDTLKTALVNNGVIPDSLVCDQMSDIPKDVAKKLVTNRRATVAMLKATF